MPDRTRGRAVGAVMRSIVSDPRTPPRTRYSPRNTRTHELTDMNLGAADDSEQLVQSALGRWCSPPSRHQESSGSTGESERQCAAVVVRHERDDAPHILRPRDPLI